MKDAKLKASWRQIKFHCKPDDIDELENLLFDLGIHSITLKNVTSQSILEPAFGSNPLWDNLAVVGLFDPLIHETSVEKALRLCSPNLKISWDNLNERNWTEEHKRHFIPIRCGKKLSICPSWIQPSQVTKINLILDPGMAFGTGEHPSTRLCLNWLDQQFLQDLSILDYGCGSGILGIAALLLGASNLVAVDHDPQALMATRDNAKRNKINLRKTLCFLPEDLPPNQQFDLILANILAQTLIELEPLLASLTSPGGLICLSGILKEQTDEVRNQYNIHFDITTSNEREGWISLSGQKRK